MVGAQARIADIINVTEGLGAIMAAEYEMLATKRTAEIAAHQEKKARFAQAYQNQIEALRSNPSWLRAIQAADVDRLKAATRRFHEILERHRRAVLAAKTVTERLLKAVGDEIGKRQRPVTGYDETASVKRHSGPHAAPAISVALNQMV